MVSAFPVLQLHGKRISCLTVTWLAGNERHLYIRVCEIFAGAPVNDDNRDCTV